MQKHKKQNKNAQKKKKKGGEGGKYIRFHIHKRENRQGQKRRYSIKKQNDLETRNKTFFINCIKKK